ncbi:hypothetical protein L3X38_018266 [Prunus dulcis]|uniref:Uncharacterized protein n=1 Tax=Prunus dulcis TaxID=3755 RepID=A0AAD4ZAY6_PRUDU|nr:hypothetical protein L3X38_018266 [Prunus dulcis]
MQPLSATSAEYSKRGDAEVAARFTLMQPIHHHQILPARINQENVVWRKISGRDQEIFEKGEVNPTALRAQKWAVLPAGKGWERKGTSSRSFWYRPRPQPWPVAGDTRWRR